MTTIRLSDRLELRPCASGHDLYADDEYLLCLGDAGLELAALANPPRYDLPNGVIHGSDGKFYAPGDVVLTLRPEEWERKFGTAWWSDNDMADPSGLYEVRPTAANPLQPLPEWTFRLPDGELACYRRDAAKLREAGAKLRRMDGSLTVVGSDDNWPDMVLLVEFPAPPKTERVPWQQSIGRILPNGKEIIGADATTIRPRTKAGTPAKHTYAFVGADGTVEVLATDGAL